MARRDASLKLLIDMKRQRVVFGEADKTVVDFLFQLLSLPLGTVCKLLKQQGMVGCLGNLYQSVETLNQTYLQPNINKKTLLNPKIVSVCSSTSLLPYFSDPSPYPKFYTCLCKYTNCSSSFYYSGKYCYISDEPNVVCPECKNYMTKEATYVEQGPGGITKAVDTMATNNEEGGGYVKGVVTYMVMDDLSVQPMSTISTITLLNNFNIENVSALEEKLVTLDFDQGVKMLRASLQSDTVLTDVFLG